MRLLCFLSRCGVLAVVLLVAAELPATAQTLSFQQAIELAVSRSTGMGIAVADQQRANQSYREARDAYVPQLIFGSGLAKTWGFPLSIEGSAPSVFQVNAQSFLLNFAQKQFVKAARSEWQAASLATLNQRNATILDVALSYDQVENASAKIKALQKEAEAATRSEEITRARVQAGVNPKVDLTRDTLNEKRVRLKLVQAQADLDLARQHLAQLTGLPAESLQTSAQSMPALPALPAQPDPVNPQINRAIQNSTAVQMAEEEARAKDFRARGEHKALLPAVDLVGTYGLFSRYNNYADYFKSFQRNNAALGVAIRVPFLNAAQRAHAAAADAEAVHAHREAEATRNRVSAEVLKLQSSVQQIAAAKDVAQLEYELALADADAVQAKVEAGTASPRDQQNAQLEVNDKYAALLDAALQLDKARMQLLNSTGDLATWALGQ